MKTFTIYLSMSAVRFANFNKFLFQALLLGNLGLVSACGYMNIDMVSGDSLSGSENSYPPIPNPPSELRQQIIIANAGSSTSASALVQMKARLQVTVSPSKQLGNHKMSASFGASSGGVR